MEHGSPMRNRRGFILITVLFITSILLSTSVSFALYAKGELRRASDERTAAQARSVAQIVCDEVRGWIERDDNDYDSELEMLYRTDVPIILVLNEWTVAITISPQNRLVPINGLFLPDGVTMKTEFEHLWERFWVLAGNDRLGQKVLDFIDKDTEARPGSIEEEYFLNAGIDHLSLLLRMPEISTDLLYHAPGDERPAIDMFFTELPSETVNVNVAPAHILNCLDEEIREDVAEAIVQYRSREPIRDEKDLLKIPGFPMTAHARLANVIGYKSDHFLVKMNVSNGSQNRNFEIMLHKDSSSTSISYWRE